MRRRSKNIQIDGTPSTLSVHHQPNVRSVRMRTTTSAGDRYPSNTHPAFLADCMASNSSPSSLPLPSSRLTLRSRRNNRCLLLPPQLYNINLPILLLCLLQPLLVAARRILALILRIVTPGKERLCLAGLAPE